MKKIVILCLVALLLLFPIANVEAATGSTYRLQGGYRYDVSVSNANAHIFPLVNSQAQHTQGTTTTISVSWTHTNTSTATSSLTAGGGIFYELTVSLGVSQSQSISTGTTVAYTLNNNPSGLYRIEQVFPSSRVNQYYSTFDGYLINSWSISRAPDINKAYVRLNRYQ